MPHDAASLDLTKRLWAELHAGPPTLPGCGVALSSKGPIEDHIPGLSDIDYRVTLDTREPAAWRWAEMVFYRVFLQFARDYPNDWRLVEHPPGSGYAVDELTLPKAAAERLEWVLLEENQAGVMPPVRRDVVALRPTALARLCGYASDYDVHRDPPINLRASDIERHWPFSVCWHYYAPAMRYAAIASGADVTSKWDALRWRAEQGSAVAAEVLRRAEAGFIEPAGALAKACDVDISKVARTLAAQLGGSVDSGDPWPALREEIQRHRMSLKERVAVSLCVLRMFAGRWKFYEESPEGFDLPAVLRIDRGHLSNYVFKSIWDDPSTEDAFYAFADDADGMREHMNYFKAEHGGTDVSRPRVVFAALRRRIVPVRAAMESWYASL